jgi:hypothetical protein
MSWAIFWAIFSRTQLFTLFQDHHVSEVRTLQVKLEEQQEKNNTLAEVNSVLRDQVLTSLKIPFWRVQSLFYFLINDFHKHKTALVS